MKSADERPTGPPKGARPDFAAHRRVFEKGARARHVVVEEEHVVLRRNPWPSRNQATRRASRARLRQGPMGLELAADGI